jgi:hypothetical protein
MLQLFFIRETAIAHKVQNILVRNKLGQIVQGQMERHGQKGVACTKRTFFRNKLKLYFWPLNQF